MNRSKTHDAIAVMQAYIDGKKIEYRSRYLNSDMWFPVDNAEWNWSNNEYRISSEQEYIPYDNMQEIYDDAVKYKWLVRNKELGTISKIYISPECISANGTYYRFKQAFEKLFWENGIPFGKKIKD